MVKTCLPPRDRDLIQIVDAALAETSRKSGAHLACRPGCTQCCIGTFRINQLDAQRLRQGLRELHRIDPERARRVSQRAKKSRARLSAEFPGDQATGLLHEGPAAEKKFSAFGNDEPCPVLDPETGLCDLYESRPMTCRVFGPPVRNEAGLGVCELCFQGATDEEIAACEMIPDPDGWEEQILSQLDADQDLRGETIVAFCLADR